MKIVCISDTHNLHHSMKIPDGDMLIHCGDSTGRGDPKEISDFLVWVGSQPHKYKVIISGNHDFCFERNGTVWEEFCKDRGIIYLNDSGVEIDGIKIWGSPVQPEFFDWAFNRNATDIKKHWELIPKDTDVLITHGPPEGILDVLQHNGYNAGCPSLAKKILEIKPKLHVFGHIHEHRGVFVDKVNEITYVNASSLDRKYRLRQEHYYIFDWDKVLKQDSIGSDIL